MGSKETEDGRLVPFYTCTRFFDTEAEPTVKHLQEAWPMVNSAFEEHGLSCQLNMVEGAMKVSTTTKTRDPDIFDRAWAVLELLLVLIPFSMAKQILDNKLERAIFSFWSPSSALRKRYSRLKFARRWRFFMNEWERDFKENIGRENLYAALGCFMFVLEKTFTVVVYGPPQGINVVRRFLLNCILKRISPLEQLHDLEDTSAIQGDVMKNLFEDFGVTSLMEAVSFMKETPVFRDQMNESFAIALRKMQYPTMLEAIADKCSSPDSPEVRAKAADTFCAILKFAPPELLFRGSIRGLIGYMLGRVMESSGRKSGLVNVLSVFLSLLDPEVQLFEESDYICEHRNSHCVTAANFEVLQGILDYLGGLLELLDDSSVDVMLLTSYGRLQPPLGTYRLKIVQLISVLLRVDYVVAENQLICLGAVPRILDLLFKYPFNNFLHHHVEKIIESCLESKNSSLVHHVIHECDIVGKILEAEKNFTLAADSNKPTVPAKGRSPPRRGNIGHLTRISNKIVELGNTNSEIQAYLQKESEWTHWHSSVLSKRMAEDNVLQWSCGRPDGGSGKERKRTKVVLLDIDGS